MLTRTDKGYNRVQFDSLPELSRYITDTPAVWSVKSSTSDRAAQSWDLAAGYDGSVRLAREGWLEGAREAQEALKAFTPETPSTATRVDFYGHMPHVPRYCAGAPDAMIRHHPQPTIGGGRVLTLYVPVCANAGTSALYMRNMGLGVVQYINQLETDGMRVELYGCFTAEMPGRVRLTHTWRLKSADQPLDLAVVAFALGHPAMLRRLGFALHERSPKSLETYSYGQARDTTLADLIEPPAGSFILNGMREARSYATTPESALAYITKQIEAALGRGEE